MQNKFAKVPTMKTLTLTLENELEQRLAMRAKLEQRSETEILLEALEAYIKPSIPDWVGIGASKEALSERDEEILKAEWQ
jgi:predicted DNA-binding protein